MPHIHDEVVGRAQRQRSARQHDIRYAQHQALPNAPGRVVHRKLLLRQPLCLRNVDMVAIGCKCTRPWGLCKPRSCAFANVLLKYIGINE